jgi:hypothetical protein
MTDFVPCPLCGTEAQNGRYPTYDDRGTLNSTCFNCGNHGLSQQALEDLPGRRLGNDDHARLGFALRKLPQTTIITNELLDGLLAATTLPPALERIDNLVLFLAETVPPGESLTTQARVLHAVIGATSDQAVEWAIEQAVQLQYLSLAPSSPGAMIQIRRSYAFQLRLTLGGWQRHGQLMRDGAGSRHAFMAMPFGKPEMDVIYRAHMRPAVARAGFELRTTQEGHQTAGSIDNRMRVEIRTSRFLVCDLTHGNRGAYWEAGFAEGLGRPVFYTCRADVLKDRANPDHPHFDTAHQLIIGWDPANLADGMDELTAAIRATLPAEAQLEDR